MNHSRRRVRANRHAFRKRRAWSDDPHEDFVFNCLAVLYDAAAKFTGGVITGLCLLAVAIARVLWSIAAQVGRAISRDDSRNQASK